MKSKSLPFLSSLLSCLPHSCGFSFCIIVASTLRKPIKISGKNLPRQTVVLPLEMLLLNQTKLFASAVISL